MKPFAIVPRFTAENKLRCFQHDQSNVVLTSQSHSFMTGPLFESWATTVCFPIIGQRRRDLGSQDKALLFMDGLGFCQAEQFLVECAARNIEVLFLTSHASDQLQALAFFTFAIMK
jgi:hypothetical protein